MQESTCKNCRVYVDAVIRKSTSKTKGVVCHKKASSVNNPPGDAFAFPNDPACFGLEKVG